MSARFRVDHERRNIKRFSSRTDYKRETNEREKNEILRRRNRVTEKTESRQSGMIRERAKRRRSTLHRRRRPRRSFAVLILGSGSWTPPAAAVEQGHVEGGIGCSGTSEGLKRSHGRRRERMRHHGRETGEVSLLVVEGWMRIGRVLRRSDGRKRRRSVCTGVGVVVRRLRRLSVMVRRRSGDGSGRRVKVVERRSKVLRVGGVRVVAVRWRRRMIGGRGVDLLDRTSLSRPRLIPSSLEDVVGSEVDPRSSGDRGGRHILLENYVLEGDVDVSASVKMGRSGEIRRARAKRTGREERTLPRAQ